jgi:putative ABC transport system permease protein
MRLLRPFLFLYPRDFREEHGEEILDLIEQRSRDGRRPRAASVVFWAGAVADLIGSAFRLRLDRSRDRTRRNKKEARSSSLIEDLRYAVRTLSKAPSLSLLVVATLAAGIGLTTAVFGIVQSVLLEPPPYREPGELVYVGARWSADGVERALHTGRAYYELRGSAKSFRELGAIAPIRQNLTGGPLPLQVQVGWVSHNFFDLLGVEATLGRTLAADDPMGTALLDYGLWQSHFGGDSEIVGRVVSLDGHPYTIAGVLPRDFRLPLPALPAAFDVFKVPDNWWQNGDLWQMEHEGGAIFHLVGRLARGSSVAGAQEEMSALGQRMRERSVEWARAGLELTAVPLQDKLVERVRPTLTVIFAAVGFVLLIACANVMNLMLVRAEARRSEIALRVALGASRRRLSRMLFCEGLLLSAAGCLLGLALAATGRRLIEWRKPADLLHLDTTTLDGTVLLFAAAITLGSTLVSSLAPALGAARRSVSGFVRAEGGGRSSRRRGRQALVVFQIALSLVLLIGAGLLTESLARLQRVELGFEPENLLTFSVSLPGTKYSWPEGTDRFFRQFEERIVSLPGVRSAGVVWPKPLSRRRWMGQFVAGSVPEGERAYAHYRLVTPGYFSTLGSRFLDGRNFWISDKREVAVVSRRLAERAWPGASAIGRTIQANPWGGPMEVFEVIGVAEDVLYGDLRESSLETIYFDSRGWSWSDWEVDFVVRTAAPPESYVGRIRELLQTLDTDVPVADAQAMTETVEQRQAAPRFALTMMRIFAVVSCLMAFVGLYGLVAYSVRLSAHEIGIRSALGAGRGRILGLFLRQGAILSLAGVVVGLMGAVLLARYLGSLLFGVAPWDVTTFASMAILECLVALVATYLPARKATLSAPTAVLRAP